MSGKNFDIEDKEQKGPEDINVAIDELLERAPNFGALLSNLKREKSKKIPTAGVHWNGTRYELSWNPDFWKLCPLEQQVGILKHECYHIFMKHQDRREDHIDGNVPQSQNDLNELDEKEKKEIQQKLNKWNIAADMAINPFIQEFAELLEEDKKKDDDEEKTLEGIVIPEKADLPKDRTSEYYYDNLPEDVGEPPEIAAVILPDDVDPEDLMDEDADIQGTGCSVSADVEDEVEAKGSGDGDDSDEGQPEQDSSGEDGEGGDDGEESDGKGDGDIDEDRLKDSKLKEAVVEGGGSDQGEHPGEYKTTIDDLTPDDSGFPWQSYVARFFRKCGDIHLKSRMKFVDDRYNCRPAIRAERRLKLLAGVDTSGSVEQWYIEKAFGMVDPLTHFADVDIVQCDTSIRDVQEYNGQLPDIVGRGGTKFQPIFEYYEENKKSYSGIVYFTDGFARYPKEKPYQVLWIYPADNHDKCSWGMTAAVDR